MGTQSHWHSPVSLSSFSEPHLSIGSPSVRPLSIPSDPSSGATSYTGNTAQGNFEKHQNGSTQGGRHPTTIGMLPDNVLLEIFDFYRKLTTITCVWKWHLLVHVCQTWRQLVSASPHRLDLKILCTYGTRFRKNLGIWPAFPIIIRYERSWTPIRPDDEENIIFALEHHDRVCDIELDPGVQWNSRSEKFDAALQQPFPVLTRLYIDAYSDPPVLPANFLGGSAPRLQEITLTGIPYPALPVLLLSTSDLVKLDLRNIPPTGYISPEAMVVSLATLPSLDHLTIGFQSATPRPDRIRPPPVTRTVLPFLTSFEFWGASEYLEDLISHIDSPQLTHITIDYLRLDDYQIMQLSKFVDRSVGPKLTQALSMRARVHFSNVYAGFSLYPHVSCPPSAWHPPEARVSCRGINWHALDIAQFLSHFRTPRYNVVHLDIEPGLGHNKSCDMGDVDWLQLFRQFSTAQTLRLYCEPAAHVALALEDISEELVAEVLSSLDLVCVVDLDQPAPSIEKFIAARELSGCPVTVFYTEAEFNERRDSYVSK
ncbi:hypothetical protein EDB84DRAFT_1577593 [Lactarius hengduanensis]|nr:hypothetical protein EDB84DRAFT_1577593 [Lactarius hengduanensis]